MSAGRPGLRRAALALAAAAALALLAAAALDVLAGVEVTLLHNPTSPAEQAEWRRLRDPADDPAEIYGVPEGPPLRVLLLDRRDAIEPPEAPGRVLLVTQRAAGRVPLQTRTLWRWTLSGAGPALLLAGALAVLARRRAGGGAASGPGAS